MADSGVKLYETTEGADYHAVSPVAVGSLVFGLLSPVALVGSLLWIVPALAIGLAVLALRQIGQSKGDLSGRGTAYVGLALGIMFAVAGPVQVAYTTRLLADAAKPIVDEWFELLRQGEPQKALQLMKPQAQRRVLNELLWDYYKSSKENRAELEKFVASPVARAVLEYGKNSQTRFYEIARVTPSSDSDTIELVYAVTFKAAEPGNDSSSATQKTFFVLMTVERRASSNGDVSWRIVSDRGGVMPTSAADE